MTKRVATVLAGLVLLGIVGYALTLSTMPEPADAAGTFIITKPFTTAVCSLWVNDASRPTTCTMTPPTGYTYFDVVQFTAHACGAAQTLKYSLWLSSTTDSTAGLGTVVGRVDFVSGAAGDPYTITLPVKCKAIHVASIATTDDLGCTGYCSE